MLEIIKDYKGALSWGRFCSLVALIVACVGQFAGKMEASELAIWLGLALGNYSVSKLTEKAERDLNG